MSKVEAREALQVIGSFRLMKRQCVPSKSAECGLDPQSATRAMPEGILRS